MGDPLRDRRPLRELAGSHQVIEITNKISDFGRLVEVLEADLSRSPRDDVPADWRNSGVNGKLVFGYADAQETEPALELALSVGVAAICQRCLAAFELPLSTNVRLVFATSDATAKSPGGYEVWDLTDDVVSPIDIAEEALIMALPLSAMHEEPDDCVAIDAGDEPEEMTTPFASLRAQMDENK